MSNEWSSHFIDFVNLGRYAEDNMGEDSKDGSSDNNIRDEQSLMQTTDAEASIQKSENQSSIFKCPITECGRIVSETTVLSHFLTDHISDPRPITFQTRITKNIRHTLDFDPTKLKLHHVCCLGVLANCSNVRDPFVLQTMEGIGAPYNALENPYDTILIMVCRTTTNDKDLENQMAGMGCQNMEMILLWLMCTQSERPIMASIMIHNKTMGVACGMLTRVCPLTDQVDFTEFLNNDMRCLRLYNCDVGHSRSIGVEVRI